MDWLVFVTDRLPDLQVRTGEHIVLTLVSTGLAVAVGIPLGIIAFHVPALRGPLLSVIGIFQTVPSLAMLAILLVLLQKIGAIPAMIALTLYALLPIVRNTVTGLEGVAAETMEAARGVGMTPFQQLRMVRLPLAASYIVAGIRTAAVVGVGIATLAAFIGAGGLGDFINRGLALSNTSLILLGAVPAGLLAIIIDFSIAAVQWGINKGRPRRRSVLNRLKPIAVLLPVFILIAGMFASGGLESLFENEDQNPVVTRSSIRIGTKNFTEQLILGELMAQVIENKTSLQVERVFDLGGTMINHQALVSGEIDLYPEYTGTALTAVLKRKPLKDPTKVLDIVRREYLKKFHAVWLSPFGFNNSYALTVRRADARKNHWDRISNLERLAPDLKAAWTAEFSEREDGYPGLQKVYGFRFGSVTDLDPAIMYHAIERDEVDVICAFTTDPRIKIYKLMPLVDDRHFFPPYFAAPVILQDTLDRHPELRTVFASLGGILDDNTMQDLNYEVDEKRKSARDVARQFLVSRGIIR